MVYCSLSDPNPGKDNFDFKLKNPNTFKVNADNSHLFCKNFFYLNFESSSDGKIEVKV